MTNLIVLFGVGLVLVLLKWAMDELFVHWPPQRPRQPMRPMPARPMLAPMHQVIPADDEDWEDEQ